MARNDHNNPVSQSEDEYSYRRFVENSRDMIYRMSLPDGHYEYVSPAALEITGYAPEEFYASSLFIGNIIHPDWLSYLEEQWSKLLEGDMPPEYEYQIIHKSGQTKWINQRNVLFYDEKNKPYAIEGILSDITSRKKAEELLQHAYDEKNQLLRELQHRAKNSFHMLISMIEMLALSKEGKETREVLNDLSTKVMAISEMYTLLFQSDSQTDINLQTYLKRISDYVEGLTKNIKIKEQLCNITLSTKSAIPVGIITVELLTNSVKHAFLPDEKGVITLSLKRTQNGASLSVKDEGVGLPESFDKMSTNSLGLKLVKALTQQIGGSFEIKNDQGTVSLVQFPLEGNTVN